MIWARNAVNSLPLLGSSGDGGMAVWASGQLTAAALATLLPMHRSRRGL